MRSHLRREGKVDRERRVFENKVVMVTGAGGSIGSQLCRTVMSQNARRLVLVSLTEAGLYSIDKQLRHEFGKYRDTEIIPVLGSYGDADLMAETLALGVDTVIHAGAHKHVPLCESNPIAAIQNNVIATRTLMFEAAENPNVERFVVISSDKAVKPTSIMGATKRVVEMMARDMAKQFRTAFVTVRFGNVLNSAGSVFPLWREQIAAGGPITMTDIRCERYFMSIPEAIDLISDVLTLGVKSGTYVFDMGKPKRLIDLARSMIVQAGREIDISFTGLRPGEKLIEELHHGGHLVPTVIDKVSQISELTPGLIGSDQLSVLYQACVERRKDTAVKVLWEIVNDQR